MKGRSPYGKRLNFHSVNQATIMKTIQFLLIISLVFLFILSATSLRCYKCYSDTSWEHCDENRQAVTCPEEHEEACSKVFYNHEPHDRQTHTKFCEKQSQCRNKSNPVCKAAKTHNAQCEVHCCTHDLCNAGSAATINGILLATCAVLIVVSLSLEENFKPSKH